MAQTPVVRPLVDGVASGEHPQLTASLLAGYGCAMWKAGTSRLLGHPRFVVQWAFYRSPMTGQGGPDARLARFLTSSNIAYNATPFPLEAPPLPAQAPPIAVRNLTGTAAERAETARLRSSFGGSVLDLVTSPGATRMKVGGARRYPDAKLTVADIWEGAVEIASETKCGLTRFQGCAGGTVAFEALVDSALVSGVNLGRSLVRGLGHAMRGLGMGLGIAGGILDVAATAGEVRARLVGGDVAGAWWAGAGFLGRWSGLLAGAVWGARAGPVGALVGGFLGAFYGGRAIALVEAIAAYGGQMRPAPGFAPGFDDWAFMTSPPPEVSGAPGAEPGELLRRELRDCDLIDYWGVHQDMWRPSQPGRPGACPVELGADAGASVAGHWLREPWGLAGRGMPHFPAGGGLDPDEALGEPAKGRAPPSGATF